MPNLTLPVYDNELKELKVHSNLKAAKDWLKKIKSEEFFDAIDKR